MDGKGARVYPLRVGLRARAARQETERKIRVELLSDEERAFLVAKARYEGSPLHKARANDFGLTPPTNPRKDKTLCDEAAAFDKATAKLLFEAAVARGLVSEGKTGDGFPKQLWVVDKGRVYELMYGGSQAGRYHGYPIRESDPLADLVRARWDSR
jgi:hypothetical protein